ncbi:MAG: hypothetical protein ACOYKB_00765 [Succiniclasticum sp.]|jgi:hypothetical protein
MRKFLMANVVCLLAVFFACIGGILPAVPGTGTAPFGVSRAWAFEQKTAHFVVLDQTGRIGRSEMAGLLTMVKMDYNRPRFDLQVNADAAVSSVENMFGKSPRPDKELMAAAAKEAGAPVLVVLVVHRMDMWHLATAPFYWDEEDVYHTIASADVYAYNEDGSKFISRRIRRNEIREAGMEEDPYDTIRYGLGNALNRMEGKPQI